MGMVFGKIDVEEPAFDIMMTRNNNADVKVPYDIRSYGKRFTIETEYSTKPDAKDMMEQTRSPFMTLAGYIGVMKEPENEGANPITMTAPVAMSNKKEKGEKIAMTAPVAMMDESKESGGMKRMQFILPSKYDSMDKIPKPTNDAVQIKEIEPSIGAVHTFTGSFNEEVYTKKAMELAEQLRSDGVKHMSDEEVKEKFQFWGYNPPFTIPFLRRNEIWIELSKEDFHSLKKQFDNVSDKMGEEKKE